MWAEGCSRKKGHSSAQAQRAQDTVKFRTAIQAMVTDFNRSPDRRHDLASIYDKYQIKRRRLYDVVNVFLGLGCATRAGIDDFVWHGRSRILIELRTEKARLGIDNYRITLSNLFPPDTCVGLTSLTRSFLLLFAAVKLETLDLRKVSAFLSRDTGRYKSTLCKLYQIALILSALGITERTGSACEVKILAPFTQLLGSDEEENPMAIANLLNRPIDRRAQLETRLQEFHGIDK